MSSASAAAGAAPVAASTPVTVMVGPSSISSPLPQGAVSLFFGRIKDVAADVLKQSKPWAEVADRSNLSKPSSLAEAATRIRKNAAYFRINYFIIMLATCAVVFVMHPSSLLVLSILLVAWINLLFVQKGPLEIGGRAFSEREKLLGMSAVSFVTIFFLTSVGTVFFSAMSISIALICLHGALREPDDLFQDEPATEPSFTSMFTRTPAPASGPAKV